ncbi:ATP-binding protein [Yinghuangia seranimata]|uniref:ATP-binding protein n=1 Tax=Yinghuangia seranimata TaxID=408067 RepID=UPI00248B7D1E|nr:ATP-binding protein [Yinghuangia seranimata]MDI2128936.1 ATP-binding protein [Yinghuangia seranimata]
MSSTLPRRVAQAALLVAAGAAPVLAAAPAQAADLPLPAVGGISQPDLAVPTTAADMASRQLEESVLGPAMWGLNPALPIAGYYTDKSLNSALPYADAALATGTQNYLVTNAAETVGGVSTPLREVPQSL